MQELIFGGQRTSLSVGRNGVIKTRGVFIMEGVNDFSIHPITSRRRIGNCCVSIPKNEVKNFIRELKEALKKEDK